MDNSVLIVLVIAAAIVVIVFLMRDRITGLRARASVDKREGEFEVKAAKPQAPPATDQRAKPAVFAVRADENKMLGENEINVARDSVDASNNLMVGKNKINVNVPPQPDAAQKKPRR